MYVHFPLPDSYSSSPYTQLVLRIVDKEYYEFPKWRDDMTKQVGIRSRQLVKGFKQDRLIDLTIDLGNPQTSSYTTTTKIVEAYNYRITCEIAKLSKKNFR